ncbi:cation:proton antiporter [Nocardia africana]|uniref:NEM-activable K(+)/H(+) antiporter n=1 Tax=Nocardia africana TaxID=134964 RepID=A0A378X720_9NOCA|nr:cation:proton antiporter [Nocardia africana]MCC3317808.1 cation:proton antiporter [Nocardia africana]SUA48575.1 NEM-activable K(+)/H(+) antiporter [Nocardia africana]
MPVPTITVLLDVVLIMAAAHLLGRLAEKIGQPPVIGEIAAGILAGPTVIGHHLSATLFPEAGRSYLTLLANIGVAVFMFVAGLELDREIFRGARRSIPAVSAAAYAIPFALGSVVAITVLARHTTGNRLHFALFVGCAMAVTAFPVLARILHDRKLVRTEIGQLSLACAALVDVVAWSVLAVVLALAHPGGVQWRLVLLLPLVGLLWWCVRPLLARLSESGTQQTMIVLGVGGALGLAAITEWIGLHLIFGAFAFGVVFPRERRRTVESGVRILCLLLMPGFFVIAGLAVDLGSVDATSIGELIAVIGVAVVGKIGSVYVAGRLTGMRSRAAAAVAALLNTRGLTELVILNVGLTTGLIGTQLYSLLVIMALVTTASTAPMLRLLGISRGDDLSARPPHAPASEHDPNPGPVTAAAPSPDMSGKL